MPTLPGAGVLSTWHPAAFEPTPGHPLAPWLTACMSCASWPVLRSASAALTWWPTLHGLRCERCPPHTETWCAWLWVDLAGRMAWLTVADHELTGFDPERLTAADAEPVPMPSGLYALAAGELVA